jgi:hypothetical protein
LLAELCQVGLVARDIAHVEDSINSKNKQIHANIHEIEKIEMMLKNVDVESVIREDFDAYHGEQMTFFRERNNHLDQEISKV